MPARRVPIGLAYAPGSEGISSSTIGLKDDGRYFGRLDRFPRLSAMNLAMEKLMRFFVGVGVMLIGVESLSSP